MADQILPEGIRFFPKHANAPDFVVGTMVITLIELFAWLKANPSLQTEYQGKKQIKLQLLNSKQGKLYAAVDTYKLTSTPTTGNSTGEGVQSTAAFGKMMGDSKDDLPF